MNIPLAQKSRFWKQIYLKFLKMGREDNVPTSELETSVLDRCQNKYGEKFKLIIIKILGWEEKRD